LLPSKLMVRGTVLSTPTPALLTAIRATGGMFFLGWIGMVVVVVVVVIPW